MLVALAFIINTMAASVAAQLDPRLLALPTGAVTCIRGEQLGMRGVLDSPGWLFVFNLGAATIQVRGPAGQTVMSGGAPRAVSVTFTSAGEPMQLVDSVFTPWRTWVANVSFPTIGAELPSYTQLSSIDSAAAWAIAQRLGPSRLLEAADSASRLLTPGPHQPLDSLGKRKARELAMLLWSRRCPATDEFLSSRTGLIQLIQVSSPEIVTASPVG